MTSQLQLQTEIVLEPPGLKPRNLWDLVDRYERGVLKPPPHQREPSWPSEKKIDYIQRVTERHDPPGSFETYQLKHDSTVYLNDGNNRLWTLLGYIQAPWEHGHQPDLAENYLRACEVGINHHHYTTHRQAHIDFILVNFGLIPTPYEQLRGLLLYLGTEAEVEGYKLAWDRLHSGIRSQLYRVVSQFSSAKYTLHKQRRHDLAMFFRCLTQDRGLNDYRTSSKGITETDLTGETLLEMRLIHHLDSQKIDLACLNTLIDKFLRLIEHEMGTIQEVWNRIYPNHKMQPVTLRWLLEAALWKKYNGTPNANWLCFLHAFINKTEGLNRINYENVNTGKPGVFGLTLANLSDMSRLCRHLDFDKERLYKPTRPKRPQNIQTGMDLSHAIPGQDDDVFPEAASINRARGQRPLIEYDPLGIADGP